MASYYGMPANCLTATLKVESLKPAEQKACTYDQKPITLDGQMDMKVSFGDKTIFATVYVKLVAPDQLLLLETVCHHLGIVNYHPNVQSVEVCQPVEEPVCEMNAPCAATSEEGESCELKNDRTLPPVDNTLSEVTNKHIQPVKVTVLLINNFVGAKVYCLKVALLLLFCVKWT